MRTTIDLPGDLLRRVKVRAALDGLKLKDLMARYAEEGLRQGPQSPAPSAHRRSELPVARPATGRPLPALANEDIHRILDEEVTAGARAG